MQAKNLISPNQTKNKNNLTKLKFHSALSKEYLLTLPT